MSDNITVGIIIASDKGSRGEREDGCIPVFEKKCAALGYTIASATMFPDDENALFLELLRLCDELQVDVVFTSGGTALSPRDVTPEATLRAATKNVPGIAEAIRADSMRHTKRAMLSRAVSVIRNRTLIINLPGSPRAVGERLDFLFPARDHGIRILKRTDGECART